MKNGLETRTCKKCGEVAALDQFPLQGNGEGARRHECHRCYKSRMRSHYRENKEHLLKAARDAYAKNPMAVWTPAKRARANELNKKRTAEMRRSVIDVYGARCACCGETEPAFLTLDHVNNDGHKMRKSVHGKACHSFYKWIIGNKYPASIQVLCMNCNLGKARNRGICPHKEGVTIIPKGSTAKRLEAHRTPQG